VRASIGTSSAARVRTDPANLAEKIGTTEVNVSVLKSGRIKGVRFETFSKICEAVECQPSDLLEYRPED
jgi:putative transcriptional regulator